MHVFEGFSHRSLLTPPPKHAKSPPPPPPLAPGFLTLLVSDIYDGDVKA